MTAISPTDVWAVGTNSHGSPVESDYWSYPIAEHWNGSSWQTIRLPTPERGAPYVLSDVSAVSARDVWAVGGSIAGTLIEHWNGKSWSLMASPGRGATLSGLAALSRHDVWLVGYLNTYKHNRPGTKVLIEHWNGRTWRALATPHPKNRLLQSVAASSPRDIWAVGGTLVLHWNGHRWSQIAADPPAAHRYSLDDVAAISDDDAWAVGSAGSSSLVEHWNGRRWRVVAAASFRGASLSAVAAVTANDIWVAGTIGNPTRPFAAHWNGTTWTVVPPKNAIGNSDSVAGIAAVGGDDAWVVGSTGLQ